MSVVTREDIFEKRFRMQKDRIKLEIKKVKRKVIK